MSTLTPSMDLSSTLGSFADQIKKRLDAKRSEDGLNSKLESGRRDILLKCMSAIRKALQETTKISLGERFYFDIDVSDLEGWPQMELRLVDEFVADTFPLFMRVKAGDREGSGFILISLESGEQLGRQEIQEQQDLGKTAILVKRCTRVFLDRVGNYVLNPKSIEELKAIKLNEESEELDPIGAKLSQEDLFSQDNNAPQRDNLIEITDEVIPIGALAALR